MKNQLGCSSESYKCPSVFSKKPGLEGGLPEAKNGGSGLIHLRDHIVKNGVDSTVVYPCVEVLVEREQKEIDLEYHNFLFILFQT